MAVRGTTMDESSNQTNPPADAPFTAPGPGQSGSPDIFARLNSLNAGQALTPEIAAYIEALRKDLTLDANGNPSKAITIRRLSLPNGSHAFLSGNFAVILLFSAMLPTDIAKITPVSDRLGESYDSIRAQIGEQTKLLQFMVVTPADYARVIQMSYMIRVILDIATNPVSYSETISMMSHGEFYIDPDLSAVNSFISENSPHGIPPRTDIGFVLYGRPKQNTTSWNQDRMQGMMPIAAVGAYTELVKVGSDVAIGGNVVHLGQQNVPGFAAYIHITSITTKLPVPGMIPLCVAMAADQFIAKQRWIQPFISYQKGRPNLGNLTPDPKKPTDLWFAENPTDLAKWIQANMIQRPFLALDVVEGQCRIPAMAHYGNPGFSDVVYASIEQFFNRRLPPQDRSRAPFTIIGESFVGVVGQPGSERDSRCLDYLSLVATSGAQNEAATALLRYHKDPAVRARAMSDLSPGGFRPIYRCTVSEIDQRLLANIAAAIQTSMVLYSSGREQDQVVATDWTFARANDYAGSTFAVSGVGRSSANGAPSVPYSI